MFSSGNTTTLGVSVSVADDTRAEGIERFSVALLPATEGGVSLSAGRDRATVVIIDNDRKRTHSPTTHTLLHPHVCYTDCKGMFFSFTLKCKWVVCVICQT